MPIAELRRRRREGEEGFTVIETMVTMAVLVLVTGMAFSGLFGISRTAESTQAKDESITEARQAMERIIRDIRAANPIKYRSVATEYPTQISFSIYCTPLGNGCVNTTPPNPPHGIRNIEYRVVNNSIIRYVNGAATTILAPHPASAGARGRLAVVNTASQPVFTYRNRAGVALDPATAGGTEFRDCTKTVEIHLRVIDRAGNTTRPASLRTRVALRNFHEVSGC